MSTAAAVSLVEQAIDIGMEITSGSYTNALKKARSLVDSLVLLVPVDDLKGDLTERDRTFVDLEADVAEEIKLEHVKP